jgi:hypothetical protein
VADLDELVPFVDPCCDERLSDLVGLGEGKGLRPCADAYRLGKGERVRDLLQSEEVARPQDCGGVYPGVVCGGTYPCVPCCGYGGTAVP